jgi:hypothetical protein
MKRLAGLISAAALVFTVACAQSDAGITSSVKSKFAADDTVKAYQIDVDTRDHVVTLSGEVESMAHKSRAVEIARGTDGVTNVVDNLVVAETAATSGDLDIDVDVDADLKDDARQGAAVVKEGAKEAGSAVKEGAQKVKDGAEKVGSKIVDSVTDNDRDSDNDGK